MTPEQVDYIAFQFMPRVSLDSVLGAKEVLCQGGVIFQVAQRHGLTHQGLWTVVRRIQNFEILIKQYPKVPYETL